jgi:hypothetical protein
MNVQTPLICHECWPKKTNHYGPCEHALQVAAEARLMGLNDGAVDVLTQIRNFRKLHPMHQSMQETLEFIGNLYHDYQDKRAALNRDAPAGDK